MRRSVAWFVVAVLVGLWAFTAPVASQPSPKKGGVLRGGMTGEPSTIDPHMTTAVITREIGINLFETLYTLDQKYQPIPLLAEGAEALDGGRRYVIRLRKDVKFHNGKEL